MNRERRGLIEISNFSYQPITRKQPVLSDLSLTINPGERVLLLGASGSGKSTLMLALAGLLGGEDEGHITGQITIDGQSPAEKRGLCGLVMQDPETQVVMHRVFDDVAFGCENLNVAPHEISQRVSQALEVVGLSEFETVMTSHLSGGQKQRLALASILAMQPQVVLLDEPTANLDPDGVTEVVEATRSVLTQTHATLVVVEHRVDPWIDLVDRVIVLKDGSILADDKPAALFNPSHPYFHQLIEAGIWLPANLKGYQKQPLALPNQQSLATQKLQKEPQAQIVLKAQNLSVGYEADKPVQTDFSYQFEAGKSYCIVGENGAGKTTLALTLAGLLNPLSGSVTGRSGESVHSWKSHDYLGRLGFVFQQPEAQFVTQEVIQELTCALEGLGLSSETQLEQAHNMLKRLGLDHLAHAHPFTLSGGEKRRLSVATALICAPEVIILDEPTFGQDATTWCDLVDLLHEAQNEGVTIISITHDEAFIDLVADEIIKLSQGDKTAPPPHTERASFIDTVNPVSQFVGLIIMTTPLLFSIDLVSATLAVVLELIGMIALKLVSFKQFFKTALPLLFAAPLMGLSMLLYAKPAGDIYWTYGPATISDQSIMMAASIMIRVFALALPALILLRRIDPSDMAQGLSQILRLPARPVLASLAGVRLVSLFAENYETLRQAYRVRGVMTHHALRARFQVMFALIVFALRRSASLSLTMEARGFGYAETRTWASESKLSRRDVFFMAGCIAIPVISLMTAWFCGQLRPFGWIS